MSKPPMSTRDRILLGLAGAIPAPLARHLMFLLNTRPALADSWGYHVRPNHYYEPLPDFNSITAGATTAARVSSAIDFDLDGQQRLVRRLGGVYRGELEAIAGNKSFDFDNEYFAGLDAALYYALIRDLRPARVIEIGSGMSTRIAAQAMDRNSAEGRHGQLICIEPYPQPRLTTDMPAVRLITERVERLPLATFDVLEADDILFIDSSHVARFGGDVCREFLEILPRVKPGVWVHVHDIFFPHDYPAEWLIEKRLAFNEQYILEAFLAFNRSFAVRAASYWLGLEYRRDAETLAPPAVWPRGPLGCGSFWMQRVA